MPDHRRQLQSPRYAVSALFAIAAIALLHGPFAARAATTPEGAAPVSGAGEYTQAWRVSVAGEEAAAIAGRSTAELKLELTPLRLEELMRRAQESLNAVETVAELLAATMIEQVRLEAGEIHASAEELAARAEALRGF